MHDDRHDAGTAAQPRDVDLFDLWTALRRQWRLLAIAVVVGAALGLAIGLFSPSVYEARVTILPGEQSTGQGLFGAVAAVTGMNLQPTTSYEEIYGRIVDSDWLLDRLLEQSWPAGDGADSVSTYALLGLEPEDGAEPGRALAARAKRRLRNDVLGFFRDSQSGFMILSVRLDEQPEAAAALANAAADLLDRFNRRIRGAKAREHREFIGQSLADVTVELRTVEDELTAFVENNRAYAASPALLQEYAQLKREVEAQTTVWVELRKQYELARVEENKSIVSVDILDRASVPIRPVAPRIPFLVVAFGFAGAVVGLVLALYRLVAARRTAHV